MQRAMIKTMAKPLQSRVGAVRCLNVHEYVSMEVMRSFKIPVPKGGMAESKEGAVQIYKDIIGEEKYYLTNKFIDIYVNINIYVSIDNNCYNYISVFMIVKTYPYYIPEY